MSCAFRVVSHEPLFCGKWLCLRKINYVVSLADGTCKSLTWESAGRVNEENKECDAVAIFPILRQKNMPDFTLLVKQFRPPVGQCCLEFPAGLLDSDDISASDCASRELIEETGYHGECKFVSPTLHSDPGLGSANMKYAVLIIDADKPENVCPMPCPEENEHITVVKVEVSSLYEYLIGNLNF